ncbi:MAG: NUDIX hydrolase [Taibaiella sp.]|nr:NUDIX hydrolase [Taibaiella sp.]
MLIQNIKLAADAMVFSGTGDSLQLLLIKRGNEPYKGMWALPGGFVEDDEELEAAAIRELEEETGLKIPSMTQLHTFGKPGRDTRGRTVTVTYYAFADAAAHAVQGNDDAAEAHWVYVKDIIELAFDHKEMLKMALKVAVPAIMSAGESSS